MQEIVGHDMLFPSSTTTTTTNHHHHHNHHIHGGLRVRHADVTMLLKEITTSSDSDDKAGAKGAKKPGPETVSW